MFDRLLLVRLSTDEQSIYYRLNLLNQLLGMFDTVENARRIPD